MPWIAAVTLIVWVPIIIVNFLVGRDLVHAIVRRLGWERKQVVRWVAGCFVFFNSYPVVVLVVFLMWGQSGVPALGGDSYLLDLLFAYPFWFWLVISVQCFLFTLTVRLIRLFALPFYRRDRERWLNIEAAWFLGTVVFLSLYSTMVIWQDTWTVRISKTSFVVPDDAAGLAGKRIVLVSDVQGDGRTDSSELADYVARVNKLHPDLLLFAGDLVTSGERYIESTADIMGQLAAPLGKFAAIGDHDMFSNRDRVVNAMRRNGFVIYDDTTCVLSVDSASLAITLVTNTYRRRPDIRHIMSIAQSAEKVEFRIFLVHQPAEVLVRVAAEEGYNLFLAGHTHGGGIAFGIPGVFLLAPAMIESRYMSGFYSVGSMLVIVTNGLGLTLAPIRFHAPAEITVIDLVKNEASKK